MGPSPSQPFRLAFHLSNIIGSAPLFPPRRLSCLPFVGHKTLLVGVLGIHYILNLAWNPTFFYFHQVLAGLFVITGLTVVIGFFLFFYWPELSLKSLYIAPYLIWLVIATSLNGYVFLKN